MGTFYWSYSQSAGGAAGDFLRSREANLAVLIMRLEYSVTNQTRTAWHVIELRPVDPTQKEEVRPARDVV